MAVPLVELPERGSVAGLGSPNESGIRTCPTSHGSHPNRRRHAMLCHLCLVFRHANGRAVRLTHPLGGAVWYHSRVETEPLVVLAIVDALLVAMFFLFRVLPWARPGPWRLIWLVAGMTSILFIAAELVALTTQGTALALEHQIPLFGAIFAVTVGFILTYLGGQRVTERALTLSETDSLTQLRNPPAFDLHPGDLLKRKQRFALWYLHVDAPKPPT